MLDAFRRMFRDVRPFDDLMLAIEVLVLLLIAYEVGSGIWQRIRRHRRSRRLLGCFSKGQALQASVPAENAETEEWLRNLKEWTDKTNNLLARYSPQASAAFLHSHSTVAGHYRGVARTAQTAMAELLERLENLRAIMERPEVYL